VSTNFDSLFPLYIDLNKSEHQPKSSFTFPYHVPRVDRWGVSHFSGIFLPEQSCYVETIVHRWKTFSVVKLDRASSRKIWGLESYIGTWGHRIESCRYMTWSPRWRHERGFPWNITAWLIQYTVQDASRKEKNSIFGWKSWFWGLYELNRNRTDLQKEKHVDLSPNKALDEVTILRVCDDDDARIFLTSEFEFGVSHV
jgi:hypothetical protein